MTENVNYPARDLAAIDLRNAVILDVRTRMEHDEKHLELPHEHIPVDELNVEEFVRSRGLGKDARIFILCRSGARGTRAAQKFKEQGYINARVIDGGIVACEEYGQKIAGRLSSKSCDVQGPISLERQVRIVAGTLVAVGAWLSLTVHPFFSVIPLFAGCGLVFAGVTDRCGMALLLTKAPWNKPSIAKGE